MRFISWLLPILLVGFGMRILVLSQLPKEEAPSAKATEVISAQRGNASPFFVGTILIAAGVVTGLIAIRRMR